MSEPVPNLLRDLAAVFNKHGHDNALGIPDFILAGLTLELLGAVKSARALQDKHEGNDQLYPSTHSVTTPLTPQEAARKGLAVVKCLACGGTGTRDTLDLEQCSNCGGHGTIVRKAKR